MGSFKEDIEKILARKVQESESQASQWHTERVLQDSLEKEFGLEVEQLKSATETTVLPLLEVVGEKIGEKPVLESYEPHGFRSQFKHYEKSEKGVVRKVEDRDENHCKKTFYDYPMVRVRLTLKEPTSHAHWDADDGTPGIYLDVLCLRKQKRNYVEVVENRRGVKTASTVDFTDTGRLEKYILTAFDRLS